MKILAVERPSAHMKLLHTELTEQLNTKHDAYETTATNDTDHEGVVETRRHILYLDGC